MTNAENFKNFRLFNDIFDRIIHNFTNISTSQNILMKKTTYISDISEIEKYDKNTGIMIGDIFITENIYIYLVIFDKDILIIDETYLQQIFPFFHQIMGINKNLIFFMNSRIQKIFDTTNPESIKKTNIKINLTEHCQKVKNQIVNCIVKKSQIRTQNRHNDTNSELKETKYEYEDFISIKTFSEDVYLSFNVKDQYLYVLKHFDIYKISKNHQFEHEISFYETHNGNNPFICKYFGKMIANNCNIIIIEYIEGESLNTYIENSFYNMSEFDKYKIILEIISVIEYMNLNGIVYRDLKYDNIMIDMKTDAIVIDFDQSRSIYGDPMTVNIGNEYFMPLEQSSTKNYSLEVDIYALGKIIHFILTGSLQENEIIDKKYGSLYKQCLNKSPKLRPKISQLFNKFIDSILNIDENYNFFSIIYNARLKLLEFLSNQQKSEYEICYLLFFLYDKYCYVSSYSMKTNFINTFKLFSNQNNSLAQYFLGRIYYFGENGSRDINKSIHYLTLSSNLNNPLAQLYLGKIYYENKYISRDINKSIYYLTLAANKNDSDAQYYLGEIYYASNYISHDINKSIYYLTLSANQNNSYAQCYLGRIYYLGEYISRDINKSIYYFTLSANQNNSDAQCLLGAIYYEFEYISVDINKSIHYLTLSANQNNTNAQYLLGKIYYESPNISQNINKSIHYFTLSANQNNSYAQYYLGKIYYLGQYISRNINKSIHYLTLSANQNNSYAQYRLGEIYYSGQYISRDINKSIHYFKESSCFYNNHAKNNLGVIYKNGDGVEKNIYLAIEYFTEAIEKKEDLYSIYNLLRIYFFEIAVESDIYISKSNELIEKLTSKNFYLGDLFLYYIYTYGNKTTDKDKSASNKNKFNISIMIELIIRVISSQFHESDGEYIFSQRLQYFFKKYDLVYTDNQDSKSDFLSFMITGLFSKPQKSEYLKEKERQEKLKININNDFYEGFYSD